MTESLIRLGGSATQATDAVFSGESSSCASATLGLACNLTKREKESSGMTFARLFGLSNRPRNRTITQFISLLEPIDDGGLARLVAESQAVTRRFFGKTMRLFAPHTVSFTRLVPNEISICAWRPRNGPTPPDSAESGLLRCSDSPSGDSMRSHWPNISIICLDGAGVRN